MTIRNEALLPRHSQRNQERKRWSFRSKERASGSAVTNCWKKSLDEAIAAYRKAIELNPKSAHAYSNLGIVLGQQKKLDEAAAAYRKAIELDPEFSSAHNNLGALLCDRLLDYEGAAASFRKAIELDPKNTSAHSNLGNALYHQGKEVEAFEAYKRAVAIDARSSVAHASLAAVLTCAAREDLRDSGQAVMHAKKAVELDPGIPDCFHVLGVASYRAGDWKAAIGAFEKTMELNRGTDGEQWFFLAMAHWQLGNKADARKWYDQSVEYMKKEGRTQGELSRFRKEAAALLGANE